MNEEEVTTAIVPVAGLARRMQPLARAMPKEMLPLGDRPVLHHVVEELAEGGIRHIIFVVGSRSESVERYFHYLPELDAGGARRAEDPLWAKVLQCSFSFVRQDEPRGVADAVKRACWMVGDHPYVVHMGDSVIRRNTGLIQRMVTCYSDHPVDAVIAVSWRIPHATSSTWVAKPHKGTSGDKPFWIQGFQKAEEADRATCPFIIGRYLLKGPMPRQLPTLQASQRFGGLTPLMSNGANSSVMAVPLIGDERLLGGGTLAEYAASWRHWLASEVE